MPNHLMSIPLHYHYMILGLASKQNYEYSLRQGQVLLIMRISILKAHMFHSTDGDYFIRIILTVLSIYVYLSISTRICGAGPSASSNLCLPYYKCLTYLDHECN